jgi:preprotein translocase subunit Sec61beta
MTDDFSDQAFADRAVKRLPLAAPSPELEAALLAAYDAWNAERRNGSRAAWKAGLRRFSETIWPGAPVWAPASALAAALLVGAGLGAALPAMMNGEPPPGFSLERTASFSLLSPDLPQEDL